MTPLAFYHKQCAEGTLTPDIHQEAVLQHLDELHAVLTAEFSERNHLLSFLRRPRLIRGVYLWGRVGIGKTFMMDAFFQCLSFPQKMRMHFHSFMAMVHEELTLHQGKKNPLGAVADDIARRALVICFDELTVSDITDAMLLGGLFDALFSRGVCLVTTSNMPPDDLYRNGLQRERFLPAIQLLKKNTEVVYIPSETDYRLRHLSETGTFFTPLNAAARTGMAATFTLLAKDAPQISDPVIVQGRPIPVIRRTQSVIWFKFSDICQVPRSQQDYLEIARCYQSVLISDIPVIPPEAKDTICLFVSLVDVLYDARIRLVISAAESVADIYRRGFMTLEYARTHSRLLEMQSSLYFHSED